MQETPQDWDEEHRGCATDLLRGVGWSAALLWAFVAPPPHPPLERMVRGQGGGGCQGAGAELEGVWHRGQGQSQSGDERGRPTLKGSRAGV